MASVTSKDGTSIVFDRYGDGPPLILVDGALGTRGFGAANAGIGERLGDAHAVYDYDRRGRGDSGDTLPYATEREIEDLAALVAEAGGQADACGLSSGCVVALDAVAAGVPIRRLALYEPPFVVDDGSRAPVPADYLARLDAALAAGRREDALRQFFTESIGMPPGFADGLTGAPVWPTLEALAPSLAYDGRFMDGLMGGSPLPADRWSGVTIPLLILHGGATEPWLKAAAAALGARFPAAQRAELPEQTHDVAAAAIAPVLRTFLASD